MSDRYQLIDDAGWLAIASTDVDDYGCSRLWVRRTNIRLSQAGFNHDDLPLPAGYSGSRRQWYYEGTVGGRSREFYFAPSAVPEQAVVTAISLPADQVEPSVIMRRLRTVRDVLAARGNTAHSFHWPKGKIPKVAKELFREWSDLVIAGGNPDDSPFWDAAYAKIPNHTVNSLYDATVTRGIERSQKEIKSGDLMILFGPKGDVPEVIVGEMPDIDWCAPPERSYE